LADRDFTDTFGKAGALAKRLRRGLKEGETAAIGKITEALGTA
jgi:hypothetical protein